MTAQTKQEELREKVIFRLPVNSGICGHEYIHYAHGDKRETVDNVIDLINSEVLSVLEELENDVSESDYALSAIDSIKNRYRL